jgi:hypothetical protein
MKLSKSRIEFSNCADVGGDAGLVVEILSELNKEVKFKGFELSKDVDVFWLEFDDITLTHILSS